MDTPDRDLETLRIFLGYGFDRRVRKPCGLGWLVMRTGDPVAQLLQQGGRLSHGNGPVSPVFAAMENNDRPGAALRNRVRQAGCPRRRMSDQAGS